MPSQVKRRIEPEIVPVLLLEIALRIKRLTRASGLVVLLAVALSPARADWRVDGETDALYDSNVSNSDRGSDVKDDCAWQTNIQVGNGFQLTRDLRLNLAADLRSEVWARFDAFDQIAPGGTAGLRYRFGLGRRAPWLLVEDRVGYASFKDEERSGLDNTLRVRAGLGISERLAAEGAYTFDDFEAKDSFWNLSGHGGALRFTFDATSALQLALGYSYRKGDVVSYALPPRPDIVALASQRQPEDAFGSPLYTAYRLHGSTNAVSASASYSLGKYTSIQVTYEFRDTTRGPLEYFNHLLEAKVAFVY